MAEKSDLVATKASKRSGLTFPAIEKVGLISKWMSDPLQKSHMRPTIDDRSRETLRVEDRVDTLGGVQ